MFLINQRLYIDKSQWFVKCVFLWKKEKLEELPAVDIQRSLFQRSQSQAPLGHLTLLQSPLGAVVVESEKQQRYTAAQQEQIDNDRQRT